MDIKFAFFSEEYEFVKLWLAQVFSQLALNTFNFVLAIAIYESTKSNQSVSLVVISFGLAAFIFGVAAGVIVDNLNLKNVLFVTTIARFFVVITFLFFTGSFWGTLIVAFSLNAVSQFFFPAESAVIPSIVSKKNLLPANSLYTMSYYITQVIGYVGAGTLIGLVGYQNSIIVLAILFLLSAFFILMVKIPKKVVPAEIELIKINKKIQKGFKDCLVYIKENREVQRALIYLGGSQIIVGMFVSLLPGYAVEVLNIDVHKTGLYLVGPSIIGMISAGFFLSVFGKDKNEELMMKCGVFGAAVSVLLMSLSMNVFASGLTMFVVGFFNSIIVIIGNTMLQSQTTESMRGRIYGVLQTIVTIFALVPVVLVGYLADSVGINIVLVFVSIFILLIGLLGNKRGVQLV